MTHAIITLQTALDTARHNEPIIRSEGRIEEADRVRGEIDSLMRAIYNLREIEKPVVPEYRLLDEGEVIEDGDEYHATGAWHPSIGKGLRVPLGAQYRRRISAE